MLGESSQISVLHPPFPQPKLYPSPLIGLQHYPYGNMGTRKCLKPQQRSLIPTKVRKTGFVHPNRGKILSITLQFNPYSSFWVPRATRCSDYQGFLFHGKSWCGPASIPPHLPKGSVRISGAGREQTLARPRFGRIWAAFEPRGVGTGAEWGWDCTVSPLASSSIFHMLTRSSR